MDEPTPSALDGIRAALALLGHVGGDRAPASLTVADLIRVNEAFGALRRHVDAAYAPVVAEVARQSRVELGNAGLARMQGFRNAGGLVSSTLGTSFGEAKRLERVGEAVAPQVSLTGEVRPARHPHVAAALGSGRLSTTAADAIIVVLDRVALRAGAVAVGEVERLLVEQAPGLSLDALQKLLARAEAHLDPDGIEPREESLRADRSLTIREDRNGAVTLTAKLDPETAAPVVTAIRGMVTAALHRRDEKSRGAVTVDDRSVSQMHADALSDLCRHALGCSTVPTGASTTVVVRVSLAELQAGRGFGLIDGVAQPVSIATVRRMAAAGGVIPCVLGGAGEILDWGRERRFFTRAQRLALLERDGGCAFCGAEPGMTEAHHLLWWDLHGGRTDLANGVMLCSRCHHRIHADGWGIRIEGVGVSASVWFIPPPHVDPDRKPRLGGRRRFDLAA